MLEDRIWIEVLVIDLEVGRVPHICSWEINVSAVDLGVYYGTDENIVAKEILIINELLVVVEQIHVERVSDELVHGVSKSQEMREVRNYHCPSYR